MYNVVVIKLVVNLWLYICRCHSLYALENEGKQGKRVTNVNRW